MTPKFPVLPVAQLFDTVGAASTAGGAATMRVVGADTQPVVMSRTVTS
jgi:hypothetical protein